LGPGARRSHAIENLSGYLQSQPDLQILDFGGLNQTNLDFITGLGHRLYAQNLLQGWFSKPESQSTEEFFDEALDMVDGSADAALLWDTLQFIPPEAVESLLARLHRILAPDALLLAFFQPDCPGSQSAASACRILNSQTLQVTSRGPRRPFHPYNPRGIERLFHRFTTVKFFLTRENVQEVVVRR
jgi:hypothetical protein